MNQGYIKSLRDAIRPLIPYPRRKTWQKWFPKFDDRNIAFILKQHKIDTLIDVGANTGQFAKKMRSCGFRGRIISIEPVSRYHNTLLDASRHDPLWDIAPRMGLGSTCGEEKIAIAGALSSFKQFIQEGDYEKETVPMMTLDDALTTFEIPQTDKVALKLDVQGYEKEVFEGGTSTLNRISAILIELSLKPDYHGEVYYIDMLKFLHEKGFEAVYFSPVVTQKTFGEMWQVDALLVKRG